MSLKILHAISLFLLLYLSSGFSEALNSSQLADYNLRFRALYRANASQTHPVIDPYSSFKYTKDFSGIYDAYRLYESIDKCLWPSKAFMLAHMLGVNIEFDSCKKLSDYIKATSNTSIFIGYVSPNVRTPMSYFGHNFIVFSKDLSPFSRTVSFSAIIPDNITFFQLMVKGAIGDLQGRFSFNPFYRLLEQYLSVEQRNVSMYKIRFNEYENVLFRLQLYELYYTTFNYDFFSQNCSSELLQAIMSVKPEILNKVNKDEVFQPSEIIRMLKKNGLIEDKVIKYGSDIENLFYAEVALSKESNDKKRADIKTYILSKKSDIYFKFFKKPLNNHVDNKSRYFKYNPDIEWFKQKDIVSIPSNKIGVRYNNQRNIDYLDINYSPGLIEKNESRFSFFNETTLRFLGASVGISGDEIYLNELDLLELDSFNKVSNEVVVPSWHFYVGYKRNNGFFERANSLLEFSYGYSYGGLDYTLAIQPQISFNFTQDYAALQINATAIFWTDIGSFEFDYVPDIYNSNDISSNNIVFKYKSRFFGVSNVGFVLSNNDYFSLEYAYRF